MFDLFFNIMMYLVTLVLLVYYFYKKINVFNFIILLFNLDIFFLFIYLDINFLYGILCALISIILYNFIMLFDKKEEDIVLIKDGNVNFHEVINNYSLSRLVNYLKIRNIKLDEVAYCIKRNNHLTIIKNKDIGYPVSIIVDGNLMENNLKLIHKSTNWLKEELLNNHLLIKDVSYAYYKKNKIYFISN